MFCLNMFVQSHLTAQQFITTVFISVISQTFHSIKREREKEINFHRVSPKRTQTESQLSHLILQIHLLTGCTRVLLLTAQQQLNENGVFKFQRSPF